MTDASAPTRGLRDITRDAVRARIAEVAVDLFAERGFDEVTVEQIAAAVGISARSFHRYFPAKEDVVVGDPAPLGLVVRDALAARPAAEPAWEALLHAFEALLALGEGGDDARGRRTMRVLASTPALRARNLEKHLLWARQLDPVVRERLAGKGGADGPEVGLRAQTLIQAGLVCLDVALAAWAEGSGGESPAELLRRAFATLSPAA